MRVSIVLIGCNSWSFLEKNLLSLSFVANERDIEVIYIDNGSTDNTLSEIDKLYPFAKVGVNNRNLGVSKARNRGMGLAKGEYIWILDSDTEVNQEALKEMLDFMDSNPNVGVCGCKMYGNDGKVQNSCRRFPSVKGKLTRAANILLKKLKLKAYNAAEPEDYDKNQDKPFEVDYIIGACQLIRHSALNKVGLLDEKIFYGPEDADFCLRMKQSGYATHYLPYVSIYHAYQRVSSNSVFSKINWEHIKGLAYYFNKHRKIVCI
ncbi:GT2 family glycosyltransferase [Dysgonomonadaceae bacterium PH5-43]|nr:GT2 family glycosyltransferase [Dysgonomonadaceae bacterium PH5-43]